MGRYYNTSDELYHYGVQGMKWGIRKYQNADGTLTAEGYKRYGKNADRKNSKILSKEAKKSGDTNRQQVLNKINKEYKGSKEYKAVQKAKKDYDEMEYGAHGFLDAVDKGDTRRADRISLQMDQWMSKTYTPVRLASEKRVDSLVSKYSDEYSGALLRDMGRKDTAAGRKYIQSLNIDRLQVSYL